MASDEHGRLFLALPAGANLGASDTGGKTERRLTRRLAERILPAMEREPRTFAEFWPYYLRQHSRRRTRALHYLGTTLVIAVALLALLSGRWWWLAAMPVAGYAFAWLGHFAVEHNRPATFTHPLWSLAADFRMWALWLTGRLGHELDRAGIRWVRHGG
jgi:hypothetical protein